MIIRRRAYDEVLARLQQFPAVALLGPRQVGKTTLAREIAREIPAVYLDLESDIDRAKLIEPESFLSPITDRLVILDEVHRVPELFRPVRGLIDRARRDGRRSGQYLVLGSASIDLLRQAGETLAGRISFVEMSPIDALEIAPDRVESLWVRGGFPESLLAPDDATSLQWRIDFIQTYLERDIPQLGPRIPAETLRRLWTMLAHVQGGLLNAAQLAGSLGVSGSTVATYLDLFVDLLLVRRLPPLLDNEGKRLVRSPKVYIRDSGIVHALLRLDGLDSVLGHPVAGSSWEGCAIETLISCAPAGSAAHFYRTSAGAEVDLVLTLPGGHRWAIEVKRGLVAKTTRGFHHACADLTPTRAFLVYGGSERFQMRPGVEAIGLRDLAQLLADAATGGRP